jgi:dienelactone hydrolase
MLGLLAVGVARGQAFGPPDRGEPGDAMIQAYLARAADRLDAELLDVVKSADDWKRLRPRFHEEYMSMLGLAPEPARTPLQATVTGTLEGEGFVVEKLHYQSVPGLYVTANLYRPARVEPGTRLPAVLYVCGHAGRGRDGTKTTFQSHGLWFARHGYLCLIVDTLQLGEIPGIHHGTYREGRWWWQSRGYTPAGVECWNGVRGIDYLVGRPDVDPGRLAVTGISGGGAATFWVAAADDRVKVAVPVSGMADLSSYVGNRVINGHCDCMFLYNTFQWPWTRIVGLIAPRPLLFVNSDADRIFPMDANARVIGRLERLYSLFGAGDRVDAVVRVGGHAYREDIRKAAYRFINIHLKADARDVTDSEVDAVAEVGDPKPFPIETARLRVFPTDADLPADRRNAEIDRVFVPMAKLELPESGGFDAWKGRLLADLRRLSFHHFPDRVLPAKSVTTPPHTEGRRVETEEGIVIPEERVFGDSREAPKRVLLLVAGAEADQPRPKEIAEEGNLVYRVETRGVDVTRWTHKDPPNYVERAHALLGRTIDSGRVWDVAAVARSLKARFGKETPVVVVGSGSAGVIATYAALLEPDIGGVILIAPPNSHMDKDAPALLNVLRVLDIPEAIGLLAPRPVTLRDADATLSDRVAAIYRVTGAPDRLTVNRSKAGGEPSR